MSDFFKITRREIEWGGRKLSLETGHMARQADGAVLARYGDTAVLCTVVGEKTAREGQGFFPLTVHYLERTYAVGRIPGGFMKRETKPSDKEALASRAIDRPIRPLFPAHFFNEVQIICTTLSYDLDCDPEILAMIGASAALAISGIPFLGPIAAARVGYTDGAYVLNPAPLPNTSKTLDLVVAGTKTGVLMVESEAQELSEEIMLGAVKFGHTAFQPIIDLIEDLKTEAGKEPWVLSEIGTARETFYEKIKAIAEDDLRQAYSHKTKAHRYEAIAAAKEKAKSALQMNEFEEQMVSELLKRLEAEILRLNILNHGQRVDGRDLVTIRPIFSEVGLIPRTHGSALFTRGETQALAVTTLGTGQDEQITDSIEGEYRERFMLHYNFPPYSVNEVGRMSAPGRREIGHGKLAWRALRPLLPTREKFPYTIRVVSEITESNGSSSMATVCGASLSLMDAGVPLARPVAGIAMGLIKENDNYAVLSDILGDEDYLGDMDFKVAGTDQGITALQMDIKITSITPEIMEVALKQAKEARLHILSQMSKSLTSSRTAVSTHAPKMHTLTIPRDKIRDLIGPGGKNIREICETTGARIDIEDDGTINIAAFDDASMAAALNAVQGVACDPEIGRIYTGKVVKLMEFGAFVNFMGSRDGLVHISELSPERVSKVSDVVRVGDVVQVKVLGVDDRGKIKLSIKGIAQTPIADSSVSDLAQDEK